jgi:hypothetical protein
MFNKNVENSTFRQIKQRKGHTLIQNFITEILKEIHPFYIFPCIIIFKKTTKAHKTFFKI